MKDTFTRDLPEIARKLTEALAHFPTFKVEYVEPKIYTTECVFIHTTDEIINGIVQWEYQEITIEADRVIFTGGNDRRDDAQLDFIAKGNWFAVASIVFAVLSGRE